MFQQQTQRAMAAEAEAAREARAKAIQVFFLQITRLRKKSSQLGKNVPGFRRGPGRAKPATGWPGSKAPFSFLFSQITLSSYL